MIPLAGGQCLQDLELLRQDEGFLDALGATRIPDPTTAGDFCRRFTEADIWMLMDIINQTRKHIWTLQKPEFFHQAILDADGTLAPTTGECKQGMDISYDGTWGYHPLVVSLTNTKEPLYLVNRSGNRPSHEGAHVCFEKTIGLCREAGFKQILLRGDTDFSQTTHLDRWDAQKDVQFLFGIDATKPLRARADALPETAWKKLARPAKYAVKTAPRRRPENVKERIVREREFENIRLVSEDVAEFDYQPVACKRACRMVVVRKNLSVEKGERVLFDHVRYFFYITNITDLAAAEIVLLANDRCDQENLIQQLKRGVSAMKMPVDNLVSNWAYMVMAALAWSLKAWLALALPETPGRWQARLHISDQGGGHFADAAIGDCAFNACVGDDIEKAQRFCEWIWAAKKLGEQRSQREPIIPFSGMISVELEGTGNVNDVWHSCDIVDRILRV